MLHRESIEKKQESIIPAAKRRREVSEATTTALAALDDVDAETLRRRVEPLACLSYHRPHVVAACCALLELCGLSAWGVRVDCAALRRVARHLSASAQPHAVRWPHVAWRWAAFWRGARLSIPPVCLWLSGPGACGPR